MPPRSWSDGYYFRRREIGISPMRGTEFRPIAASLKFSDPLHMSAAPSAKLSPEEKLEILRRLDEFHFWHSLDDCRMCRECGHSITGWEIQVIEGKGARDKMRLQCPTEGCVSTPAQWVYADPVLAAMLRSDIRSLCNWPRRRKIFRSPTMATFRPSAARGMVIMKKLLSRVRSAWRTPVNARFHFGRRWRACPCCDLSPPDCMLFTRSPETYAFS